jgi:di/tricarboxylate transporter
VTLQQRLDFAILGGMTCLFLWGRWRYDVVALVTLLAAVAAGIVPSNKAFSGFGNPLLPLIASALVVSRAIAKSGIVESFVHRLAVRMHSTSLQVFVLAAAVGFLSALFKNVGALAIFLPVAIQMAERQKKSAATLLMPLSFASLLGGMMTLIGTSPNLIASSVRQEIYGRPFAMLDFLPVGLCLAVIGVVFLSFGWRLIPRGRKSQTPPESLFRIEDYLAEARVPENSPYVGRTVAELEELGEGEMSVAAIIRQRNQRYVPAGFWKIYADDVLVLQCDPTVLDRIVTRAHLALEGIADEDAKSVRTAEIVTAEAVVTAESRIAGASPAELHLRQRYGINVLALSKQGQIRPARLRGTRFSAGDVVVVQGNAEAMPETLTQLGLLPLAERRLLIGQPRDLVLPVVLLLAAVLLSAAEIAPPEVSFTGAATVIALLRILTLREIYDAIEWPILVLLGALIPVGEAVRDTGGTGVVVGWLSQLAAAVPPTGVLAGLTVATMILTPLLHHAPAVIVMGPIAAALAKQLGLHGDPFLIAVAVGASCDFLTPIGHQCNTLVMGPGGYRFTDYWRLGLPLSLLVAVCGPPLIAFFWPLR